MDFLPSRSFYDDEDDENIVEENEENIGERKNVALLVVGRKAIAGEDNAHVIENSDMSNLDAFKLLRSVKPEKIVVECVGKGGYLFSSSWKDDKSNINLICAPEYVSGAPAVFLQYAEANKIPCSIHACKKEARPTASMYI